MSFDSPYGLIGWVALSSPANLSADVPYTAAVEENTICRTPARSQHSSRLRVAQVLLR